MNLKKILEKRKVMKKVIIFGINQFSELLYFNLKRDKNFEIVAFTVDSEYINEKYFLGVQVVAFENIDKLYNPSEYDMFICVGYNKMNTIRKEKYYQAKKMGYKILSYVHETSIVQTNDIGEGTIIFEGVIIGPFAKIGNCNVIYPQVNIAHHTNVGDFNFFAISCAIAGDVSIGNCCFFGNNCTLKNDIKVADYTLVGASAYLGHDIIEEKMVIVPPRSVKLQNRTSFDVDLTKTRNNSK